MNITVAFTWHKTTIDVCWRSCDTIIECSPFPQDNDNQAMKMTMMIRNINNMSGRYYRSTNSCDFIRRNMPPYAGGRDHYLSSCSGIRKHSSSAQLCHHNSTIIRWWWTIENNKRYVHKTRIVPVVNRHDDHHHHSPRDCITTNIPKHHIICSPRSMIIMIIITAMADGGLDGSVSDNVWWR